MVDPQDLRDSVQDYRAAGTTNTERDAIREFWASVGIRNQAHALLKAAELSA